MDKSSVALVKGERGHEPVWKALDLIDYKSALAGYSRVLIKVNFINTQTWDSGATTDPVVVEAIILRLKELDVETFVVESDATITNADKAYESTGMKEMCERNSVKFINLRYEKDKVKLPIPSCETLENITVPRIVMESAVISAAKMKTHMSTKVTLGMKNMFGLIPDKFKGKYHMNGISKVVVDINTVIKPVLTVIDGFVAMEGRGPSYGDPVKMDLIIAGKDVVAVDATGARAMGLDPHEISHIRTAARKDLGNIDNIEILGSKLEDVRRTFKQAKMVR
ncbi:MAG TPA: DUF362 domain-containing protein [Candidatus Acidoferrales bacterium]|nr:DUF362 domain-containing protein [Candidatus Acidoferrales bacterium]